MPEVVITVPFPCKKKKTLKKKIPASKQKPRLYTQTIFTYRLISARSLAGWLPREIAEIVVVKGEEAVWICQNK